MAYVAVAAKMARVASRVAYGIVKSGTDFRCFHEAGAPSERAASLGRRSNLDRRTTRQPGYAISLSRRWLIEKGFGWLKQAGPLRQVKLRGLDKVDWLFVFSCAAHNLIRLPKLIARRASQGHREQCA